MTQAICLERKQREKGMLSFVTVSFFLNKSLQPNVFNFKLLPFHPATNLTSLYKIIRFSCLPIAVYSIKTKKRKQGIDITSQKKPQMNYISPSRKRPHVLDVADTSSTVSIRSRCFPPVLSISVE
jgi:hypothetical protein